GAGHTNAIGKRLDGALQGTAVGGIDVGITGGAEHVAHVQHVRGGEIDVAVAVGVCGRHGDGHHFFSVEVNGDVFRIGQHGQRNVRCHLAHAHTHFVPGEDLDAHAPQVLVAAGMIAVHVGVDQEADFAIVDFTDGRQNSIGERCKLVVDHGKAIVAD